MISRRHLIIAGGALAGAGAVSIIARAQTAPMVIYDDSLQNGWSNSGWANAKLAAPFDGQKPISVEGGPWSAMVLSHKALSLAGFSKLTFNINGGKDGGLTMWLRGFLDGKPIDCDFQIHTVANTWQTVEAPLAKLKLEGLSVDSFAFQVADSTYKPYYLNKIQLA